MIMKKPQGLDNLLKTHLWLKLLLALALGVALGIFLLQIIGDSKNSWLINLADWLALPGSIYLTVIQMVIVPLILSSIILALADIQKQTAAAKMAGVALIFTVVSTSLAAGVGLGVVAIFKPGTAIHKSAYEIGQLEATQAPSFSLTPDSIVKLIPQNPLASLLNGDLLEVLLVSLLFGIVISRMKKEAAQPLLEILTGLQSMCLLIITWTVRLAPYAVFGLMVRAVVNSGLSVLMGMLGYLICCFVGYIVMIALYMIWIQTLGFHSWSFLKNSREPLLLAFSLSSSAATMPTTLETAKNKLSIAPEVAELFIPLGTTINMAGSAVWQTSATLFLAQAFGSQIDFATVLTVIVITIGASIGTPGVPGAGVGVLTSTLRTVGVPASGIPLILGVDRLVDMGCTVINVMGDLVMCATVQRFTLGKFVMKEKEVPVINEPTPLPQLENPRPPDLQT
jgi:Na+/H+-dicarboxylate symporter